METEEKRARFKELSKSLDEAYAAAEPQRRALAEALKPFEAIQGQISDMLEGAEATRCAGCGDPIFEGEPSYPTGEDETMCKACAPTYADLLASPEQFHNADDDPMTPAQAQQICDAHVATGGALTDSMAS